MAAMRSEALLTEARQAQIEQERQSRIAEHQRRIAQRNLAQPTIAAHGAAAPLNIFAEGDSWFDYPLSRDTIGWITADGTPVPEILNLAHYGDATTQMLGSRNGSGSSIT